VLANLMYLAVVPLQESPSFDRVGVVILVG
jgi:hypothetical protein